MKQRQGRKITSKYNFHLRGHAITNTYFSPFPLWLRNRKKSTLEKVEHEVSIIFLSLLPHGIFELLALGLLQTLKLIIVIFTLLFAQHH